MRDGAEFLAGVIAAFPGQAERMARTVQEATARTFHYETLAGLAAHLGAVVTAYNFARYLKGLRWGTPFQAICDAWARNPGPLQAEPAPPHPGTEQLGRRSGRATASTTWRTS
jgi:hypothetical protein